jgi:hypothetical protein
MTVGPCRSQTASSLLRASGLPMNVLHGEHFPVTSPPCSSLSPLRIGDFVFMLMFKLVFHYFSIDKRVTQIFGMF